MIVERPKHRGIFPDIVKVVMSSHP
ncbi:unnamed protein product, partial [Rotaria socialis]